jgi:hypothetical protein
MLRNPRLMLLALAVVVVLANVWLIAFTLGRPPASPLLPNPNGYNDFVKAAGLVTGDVTNADDLDPDVLRALVATNAESLRLLRLGLTRQCALPPDSVLAIGPGMADHVKALYRLANLLEAEGRLREIDGRLADVINAPVDCRTARFARLARHNSLPQLSAGLGSSSYGFGICSMFIRITDCSLADSRSGASDTKGFEHFITSILASTAAGWSESCRVGLVDSPTGVLRHCHGAR